MDGRLRWRCRRGTRELDFLLTRFLEKGYANLSELQKHTFDRLLDAQDTDLMMWLLRGAEPEDVQFAELVKLIRSTT